MKLLSTVQRILWGDDVVRIPTPLDPMIWICAATSPSFLAAAYFLRTDPVLEYILVCLAALPMLVARSTYIYLVIRDPDRLQAVTFKSAPSSRK